MMKPQPSKYASSSKRRIWVWAPVLLIAALSPSPFVFGGPSSQSSRSRTSVQSYEVRAGSVLKLKMDRTITSKTAREGDTFTTTVFEDFIVNRVVVIPRDTKVEGHVTAVEPAQRNKSGTIAVDFDRLVFAGGRSVSIEGQLTSLNAEEKRQIDEEGRAQGGSTTKRNVIFIGGGAGVGAAIGAIAGGGKGAAIGSGVGAAAGILGALLVKGYEAEVKSGQTFGLELTRTVRVTDDDLREPSTNQRDDDRDRGDRDRDRDQDRDRDRDRDRDTRPPTGRSSFDEYTDAAMVKRAQIALRDRKLYVSTIDGTLSSRTRAALKTFQRDQRLEETGRLDMPTAQALGLVDRDGNEIRLVRVLEAKALRQPDRSLRVELVTEVNSGGWDVFADYEIGRDRLEIWARGAAPRGPASQGFVKKTLEIVPREDVSRVVTVLVHGDLKDMTVPIDDFQTGLARSLKTRADRMLADYRSRVRTAGTRTSPGTFNLNENEADLYASLSALAATAQVFAELVDGRASQEAQRGGADVVSRITRRVGRALRDAGTSGDTVRRDFESFESDVRKLSDALRLNSSGD